MRGDAVAQEVMTFLLDVGNTRINWALSRCSACSEGVPELAGVGSTVHQGVVDVEALVSAWRRFGVPRSVVGSCVASTAVRTAVESAAWRAWGIDVAWMWARAEACGVINGYPRPSSLGADRWAALVAARALEGERGVCIVDAGTAVTFDFLDRTGRHLGGAIFPGRRLLAQALDVGTENVTLVEDDCSGSCRLPARSTDEAVRGGIRYGALGAVNELVARVASERPGEHRRLLTGGDAAWLRDGLVGAWEWRPYLVLEGVAVAAAWAGGPRH